MIFGANDLFINVLIVLNIVHIKKVQVLNSILWNAVSGNVYY